MNSAPNIKIDEIIEIGERRPLPLRAVVCNINPEIEIVYLQDGYKPVRTGVIWNGKTWQFNEISSMVSLSESEGLKFKNILKK